MKKRLTLILCLLLAGIVNINAQKIKLFSSYEKNVDNGTCYVVVLSDNSIWWLCPVVPGPKVLQTVYLQEI